MHVAEHWPINADQGVLEPDMEYTASNEHVTSRASATAHKSSARKSCNVVVSKSSFKTLALWVLTAAPASQGDAPSPSGSSA